MRRPTIARLPAAPVALLVLVVAALLAPCAAAQTQYSLKPSRLPAFGRNIVSTDDATALLQNPANVALMPSWQVRYDFALLEESTDVPWQGHAFSVGVPLFLGLATGLRFDAMDPPREAAFGNYRWLTWGIAYSQSKTASLGFSVQRAFSGDGTVDDLLGYSIGFTSRPFDHVGVAFVAQDLNTTGATFDPDFVAGLVVRPTGTRLLEVGIEGKYAGDAEVWIPRATLGLDIPPVGRLRGEFSIADPAEDPRTWIATAGFSFYLSGMGGSTEVGGGMVTGDGLGADDVYNPYFGFAVSGWREPVGLRGRRYAVKIRLEDTPGARSHVRLLRQLWSLAEEDRVDAVVLELRTSPGGLARVQELRDALFLLRRKGKRVLCHLEDAPGSALYLCSAANRILVNPAGGLRFAGLRSRYLYFKGLFDKLGIRADFVRIGAHKSAPESFTRTGASDVARADKIDLLQQHEIDFVEGIAAGRNLTIEQVRKSIASGPFIAPEARRAGFVDGYAFDDQIQEAVNELVGRPTLLREDKRAPEAPDRFGRPHKVAIVYVEGDMIDGRSETIPFLGRKLAGSYTIAESIKRVREDPRVGAVVLRIETGGGSAMAADVIWRQVQLTAKVKPTVVSMGGSAASGGYYIATPATRIFANPLTITGSIGIFYGKADVAGLLRKIGVNVEVYKTAPRADAESIFRPFTPDERKELRKKVAQFYDVFISRVAAGRPELTKEQVDAIGRGRVWTGEQAQARGLVDEVGGLRQALAFAREQAGLPDDAPILELPPPDQTILGRLLGIEGLKSAETPPLLPSQIHELVRALAPFTVYRPDQPLARMELVWLD